MPWDEPCEKQYGSQRFIYSALICFFSDPAWYRPYYSVADAEEIIIKQKRNLRRQSIMPALQCSQHLVSEITECIPTLLFHTVNGHRIASDTDLDIELHCNRLNRGLVPNEVLSTLTMENLIIGGIDGGDLLTGGDCPR